MQICKIVLSNKDSGHIHKLKQLISSMGLIRQGSMMDSKEGQREDWVVGLRQ